ncbi:MAG: radical SAM protein [Planctomycetes bacterium]|nr:radical SAM protein [Planctomycetota bacterium]
MNYVFGPVPSRRLGRSLGIDPIPMKTCNWNCVYCQLGRTSKPTNWQQESVATEDIIAEAKSAIALHRSDQIDWLTFVGSGEPTLHAGLGRMIGALKSFTDIPIAVITNGSLLYLPEVRRALLSANAVLPTLDAGTERLYQRIDRPMSELSFAKLVGGMDAFRQEFTGQLWLEVMLIRGLNDSEEALLDLAAVISQIQPDQVHINLPVRPPTVHSIEVPDNKSLFRARAILGDVAQVVHHADITVDLGQDNSLVDAICGLVRRHPMTCKELTAALSYGSGEITDALNQLQMSGNVQEVIRHNKRFWTSADSQFANHASATH